MALLVLGVVTARAEDPKPDYRTNRPGILDSVGFDQKPGAKLPLDTVFRNEDGEEVTLGQLLRGKPLILNLVYFDCPLLCNQVLDALVRGLNVVPYKVGEEFDVLSLSINPRDTPEAARTKEGMVLSQYTAGGAQAREGWHFLTGDAESIQKVSSTVGFRFNFNADTNLYAHPAGIVFITPDGLVSRYIYGLSYPARDMTLALSESSEGKIGSVVDQALLLCYVYDPESGSYSFAIMSMIRILGCLTFLVLLGFIVGMLRRDRRRSRDPSTVPGSFSPRMSSDSPPVVTN